jgi:hypothetical protein
MLEEEDPIVRKGLGLLMWVVGVHVSGGLGYIRRVVVFAYAAHTKGAGGCAIIWVMRCANPLSYVFSSDPLRPHAPLSSGANLTP